MGALVACLTLGIAVVPYIVVFPADSALTGPARSRVVAVTLALIALSTSRK